MRSPYFPIAALLAAAIAVCGAGAVFASGADSGAKADRRAEGLPSGPLVKPETSVRSSASYDAGDVTGTKIAFVGTAAFVGNEPHTMLVVRPEGRAVAYLVSPEEAARDLAKVQGRRLAIAGLEIGNSGSADTLPCIYVLSWKIVK